MLPDPRIPKGDDPQIPNRARQAMLAGIHPGFRPGMEAPYTRAQPMLRHPPEHTPTPSSKRRTAAIP